MRTLECMRLAAFAALAVLVSETAHAQQSYPAQPVKVVVAAGAGGFADAVARMVSEALSPRIGQTIVIENRGGAGGNIAARAVAQSAPDGYTVLVSTTSMAINGTLYKNMGYATADITPVAIVGSSPEVIAVNPSNPAKSVAQFLKPADGKPVQFGTAGVGSGSHIAAEYLFKMLAKVPSEHVAFPGGAPAIQNVIGNHLNSVVATMPALTEHIRSGALRGLGVASPKRAVAIPGVPTLVEAGYPDYYASSWVGFFVPSKTETAIVQKLNDGINNVLREAAVRERLEKSGLEIMINDTASTVRFFESEIGHWSTRVKAIGVSIN